VIRKTLAGEIENRYPSAATFGDDLKQLLDRRPTLAETEKHHAWTVNPTVEKDRGPSRPLRKLPGRLMPFLKKAGLPIAAVAAGALAGALLYIETAYAYRFWIESRPLRGSRDYIRRSVADVNSDWSLYKQLEGRNLPLGRFSPVVWLSQPLRSGYLAAADDVIERYRNSSNPDLGSFDWQKAQICLQHAAELDGSDPNIKGKLALANAYIALTRNPQTDQTASQAKASFEEALYYLPRSPDPHLGMARLDIFAFRNVGRFVAELSDAERLGFKPGPREFEQQADGYLFRAEQELQQSQRANEPRPEIAKNLSLAQGDLERARNLYEPIAGFSGVSSNLNRLYRDRGKLQLLQAASEKAAKPKKPYRRPRTWR
jgi:hypothetical protein